MPKAAPENDPTPFGPNALRPQGATLSMTQRPRPNAVGDLAESSFRDSVSMPRTSKMDFGMSTASVARKTGPQLRTNACRKALGDPTPSARSDFLVTSDAIQ